MIKEYGLYVLGGSVIFDDNGINRNRIINFSPEAEVLSFYDKIHLFSCRMGEELVISEGNFSTPGKIPVCLDLGPFKIGMSLCFDLRYPELYWLYQKFGANVMSISSAFIVPTGKSHWHTLVRARAIETQSYVVASCQWGRHNSKFTSYGHSLIVDPWGTVLVDAGEGEGVIFEELHLHRVEEVRQKIIM